MPNMDVRGRPGVIGVLVIKGFPVLTVLVSFRRGETYRLANYSGPSTPTMAHRRGLSPLQHGWVTADTGHGPLFGPNAGAGSTVTMKGHHDGTMRRLRKRRSEDFHGHQG
jgi:hypothetical protein